jgi:hypothetical protein
LWRRIEERAVDVLDVDAAVLHSRDGVGDIQQLAGSRFRVSKGAWLDEFHAAVGSM